MERGVPVRAISRAIAVLTAINRGGSVTLMEISRSAEVPYATAYRIVQTLMHEGLATRVGTRMIVRDTTHKLTSLTFSNYFPGFTLPIAECATGKAYLAFCEKEEREAIIDGWQKIDNETAQRGLLLVGDDAVLGRIRREGYALQLRNVYNAEPGKTSSLAVPVFGKDNVLAGSLAVIYFASAMKADEAVKMFAEPLKETAKCIQDGLIAASA